jgi:ABC-type polysaccharide/polyol phosphate transport system ATPase subunit
MAVIEFEDVRKAYRLGLGQSSLREAFPGMLQRLAGRRSKSSTQVLWALDGVSFQVEKGEALALIGRNGAGKTTMLKLLSRVTRPTSGNVHVRGRLSALIELGAGFHPDLTGRENVYLNGVILGLRRAEIDQRFDSIVDFSGIERFIDTPVKRYSSGMYVRLGFAVAIHVNPEILLVDEVLAVGDLEFQRKCLRAMRQRLGDITVVFVSHNLAAVNAVCQRAIWLEQGAIRAQGTTNDVVEAYVGASTDKSEFASHGISVGQRWGTGEARITEVSLLDQNGRQFDTVCSGEGIGIKMSYEVNGRIENPVFGLGIYDSSGQNLYGENTSFGPYRIPSIEGTGHVCCWIDSVPLPEGDYFLSVALEDAVGGAPHAFDKHEKAYILHVRHSESVYRVGVLALSTRWTHEQD